MKDYEKEEVKDYSKGKPLGVWIGNLGKYNEGELIGEWVRFPTTRKEINEVMKRIGIGSRDFFGQPYEEWFIGDYDCYVKGMSGYLGEYESLDELNYLTSRIEKMADDEYEVFLSAIELGDYLSGTKDLINLTYNVEDYEFDPGIHSDAELGRVAFNEWAPSAVRDWKDLANYFDYEKYGRDIRLEEGGIYTAYGYVACPEGAFLEIYSGEWKEIPEEYLVFHEPENYLENTEVILEDDYGMIDGIINNAPRDSVKERLKEAEERSDLQAVNTKEKAKEEICL